MRLSAMKKSSKPPFIFPIMLGIIISCAMAYPSPADEFFNNDKEFASPGAHQLASWLASQMRPKEITVIKEYSPIPYRLPLQAKRNSEVTNAIIGSEETQKMYRDGKK